MTAKSNRRDYIKKTAVLAGAMGMAGSFDLLNEPAMIDDMNDQHASKTLVPGDVVDILSTHGIGIALWNFRGSFGILDSGREDVDYEDWYGHKLDRKLLD